MPAALSVSTGPVVTIPANQFVDFSPFHAGLDLDRFHAHRPLRHNGPPQRPQNGCECTRRRSSSRGSVRVRTRIMPRRVLAAAVPRARSNSSTHRRRAPGTKRPKHPRPSRPAVPRYAPPAFRQTASASADTSVSPIRPRAIPPRSVRILQAAPLSVPPFPLSCSAARSLFPPSPASWCDTGRAPCRVFRFPRFRLPQDVERAR